jgi:tRNA threonylcarbamoyladenosine biosynthesis protein TsaE
MNSTSIKIITDSSAQTQKVAELLVKTLSDKKYSPPHVFALQGNLGAGKTTFIQGVAKALKIKQKILSPTFVIVKDFALPKNSNFSKFYHIDCYRLNDLQNYYLDLRNNQNLKIFIFIEWPERIKKLYFKYCLD